MIKFPNGMECALFLTILCFITGCGTNPVSGTVDNRRPSDFSVQNIIVNEFMVLQNGTLRDPDFGNYSGWIELKNDDDVDVDLGGWIIAVQETGVESGVDDGNSYTLPDGLIIEPGEFMLIWTDRRGILETALHTSFTMPISGGTIGLYGPEWAESPVIDTVSYTAAGITPDISRGRMKFAGYDHPGFWLPMNDPSPGGENRLSKLQQVGSYPLKIGDPSGLGPDHTGNYFWTVSDNPGGSIYKISRTGTIVAELAVNGHDMEGITQHPVDHTLWVAEERKREIVQFDTLGRELQRISVDVEMQRENDGLEGIAVNPANNHIFLVNKRLPRMLIELDITREAGEQGIQYTPVNFQGGKDDRGITLSGLYFESGPDLLWIVSDEARAVFILDLNGEPLAAFDADEYDLEAIAIIPDAGRIYLVSDNGQMLFEYLYPDPLHLISR